MERRRNIRIVADCVVSDTYNHAEGWCSFYGGLAWDYLTPENRADGNFKWVEPDDKSIHERREKRLE